MGKPFAAVPVDGHRYEHQPEACEAIAGPRFCTVTCTDRAPCCGTLLTSTIARFTISDPAAGGG